MSTLRLRKLPDRTPIKVAITLSPDLRDKLQDYAVLYHQTYGVAEPVSELIPAIIESFLDSDRTFARLRAKP